MKTKDRRKGKGGRSSLHSVSLWAFWPIRGRDRDEDFFGTDYADGHG